MNSQSNWLSCLQSFEHPLLRLFCFPYAGGTTQIFQHWAKGLHKQVEIYSLQLPGRGIRYKEPLCKSMSVLIENLLPEFLPLLDKPYALFGHSMGALVSFALLREVRRHKRPLPKHFFVSARQAPHLPNKESLHHLPNEEFVKKLQMRYNGIPQVILQEPDLLALFLNNLKSDFEIFEKWQYIPEEPFSIPISVFGGTSDREIQYSDLEAWKEHTTSKFAVHMINGDHFFIQSQQATLLSLLSQKILEI